MRKKMTGGDPCGGLVVSRDSYARIEVLLELPWSFGILLPSQSVDLSLVSFLILKPPSLIQTENVLSWGSSASRDLFVYNCAKHLKESNYIKRSRSKRPSPCFWSLSIAQRGLMTGYSEAFRGGGSWCRGACDRGPSVIPKVGILPPEEEEERLSGGNRALSDRGLSAGVEKERETRSEQGSSNRLKAPFRGPTCGLDEVESLERAKKTVVYSSRSGFIWLETEDHSSMGLLERKKKKEKEEKRGGSSRGGGLRFCGSERCSHSGSSGAGRGSS